MSKAILGSEKSEPGEPGFCFTRLTNDMKSPGIKWPYNQSECLDADWGQTWNKKTTGKEDDLPSPYLGKEFSKAKEMGIMPTKLSAGIR